MLVDPHPTKKVGAMGNNYMNHTSHCRDCCCAKSWKALGITDYTGKSIPEHIAELRAEVERLSTLINTPYTAEFLQSVHLEAIHQRERWAADHDAGKTDADWFWLVGYLAGKALHKPEKQVHHIITTAAALLNWHAAKTGADTRMRPGIDASAALGEEVGR